MRTHVWKWAQLLSIASILSVVTAVTAQGCSPEIFVVDGEAHNNPGRDGKTPIERLSRLLKETGAEPVTIQLFDRDTARLKLGNSKVDSAIEAAASAIAAPNALILLHKSAFSPQGSTTEVKKLEHFLRRVSGPVPFIVIYSRSGEENLKNVRTEVEKALVADFKNHIEIVANNDGVARWGNDDRGASARLQAFVTSFLQTCTLGGGNTPP